MTASTIARMGKRVRAHLPADLAASLHAAGVESFIDHAGVTWEWSTFKTRYVRTAAGARRYGLPIGSPIVGKGRNPSSGGGGGGGGDADGGGAAPPQAPSRPRAANKPAGDGNRVRPTPAQRVAAEQHFGSDPGNDRGAYVDGNRVVVEDRDKAVAALDRVLADPALTPGERKSRKNLRDKIAATEQASAPEPVADDLPSDDAPADLPDSPDPSPDPNGDGAGDGDTASPPLRPATPEGARDAYWDLASERSERVRIAELRKRMGGTRAEQDEALRGLAADDDVLLRAEVNQQNLTPEDRAAAIRLGGDDRHRMQIDADPPSRRDATATGDEQSAPAPPRTPDISTYQPARRSAADDWTGGDFLDELRERQKRWNVAGGADPSLAAAWRQQGFDAKPTVVSAEEFDALPADHERMYRGITSSDPGQAQRWAEDYRSGDDPFPGWGIYGNGTYAATDRTTAEWYARSDGPRALADGAVLNMALQPNAKIFDYNDAVSQRAVAEWLDELKAKAPATWDAVGSDIGVAVSMMGYDAIRVDNPPAATSPRYYVIMNRSALIISGGPTATRST